jgi:hypothetical protein
MEIIPSVEGVAPVAKVEAPPVYQLPDYLDTV